MKPDTSSAPANTSFRKLKLLVVGVVTGVVAAAIAYGIFALTHRSSPSEPVNAEGTAAEVEAVNPTDDNQGIAAIAEEFVKAWYNDWTFEDGEEKRSGASKTERCLPYIAEGTTLYDEFSDESNFGAGSGSRLSQSAAYSVADINVVLGDGRQCTVEVWFYAAQNTITQEQFDQMKGHPANRRVWSLTFDDAGKVTELENAVVAEDDISDAVAQYESILNVYREGVNSESQPLDDRFNLEVWAARDSVRGRLAYAMFDIDGDGQKELLIGMKEPELRMLGGLENGYGLFDLYTIGGDGPVRVLDAGQMASLGYRAYCIVCENGILATGGSGGATLHGYEFWRVDNGARGMELIWDVTDDDGEFTFVDEFGNTEVAYGDYGQEIYDARVAGYVPITGFVWHAL